jgi:hypothetical protein
MKPCRIPSPAVIVPFLCPICNLYTVGVEKLDGKERIKFFMENQRGIPGNYPSLSVLKKGCLNITIPKNVQLNIMVRFSFCVGDQLLDSLQDQTKGYYYYYYLIAFLLFFKIKEVTLRYCLNKMCIDHSMLTNVYSCRNVTE